VYDHYAIDKFPQQQMGGIKPGLQELIFRKVQKIFNLLTKMQF